MKATPTLASARLLADQATERRRALHALPDGRSKTVSADTRLDGFPEGLTSTKDAVKLMTARLERTVRTKRDVHDDVDGEDPASADPLHPAIERLEQLAWMVNAERMTTQAAVTEPEHK